eukprot:TRINITY_DN1829_c1_g1_i1.p1 TRINITY_DN1829_c1_g1~~TRINITY_DN1829_c1_g1_i1.p1  ORF type:complete len:2177 (-),score=533.78 TRINITY_DN1829_c1_g1_i1:2-6196(-)
MVGEIYSPKKILLIRNAPLINIIFSFFANYEPEVQSWIIDVFLGLISISFRNLRLCCQQQLALEIAKLLAFLQVEDELRSKMLLLLEVAMGHSSTVKEMKRIFRLIPDVPEVGIQLLQTIQKVLHQPTVGPQIWFDFDGLSSGIVIPKFKFPSKGFTFFTWIRTELIPTNDAIPKSVKGHPRLFSFLNSQGDGCEAFITETTLSYQCIGQPTINFNDVSIEPMKWINIAIVHTASSVFANSEVKLYIDGKLKASHTLKYGPFENMDQCRIGSTKAGNSANNFCGQMGPCIYLLGTPLSPFKVEELYSLGPQYYRQTIPEGNLEPELSKKVIFAYNPKACMGKVCLGSGSSSGSVMNAELRDIVLAISKNAKDTIYCLGGVKIILELLLKFKLSNSDLDIPMPLFDLIVEMLQDSTTQNEMLKLRGFSVLSFLLQQKVHPSQIKLDVIEWIKDLILKISNQALLGHLFTSLLFDFRLWVYTDIQVQSQLMKIFLGLGNSHLKHIRENIGVTGILDIIRLYYWQTPDVGATRDEIFDPTTKSCIGKRPTDHEMIQIRENLLDLLKNIVLLDSKPDDAKIILNFLLSSKDVVQTIGVLQLVEKLVIASNASQFREQLTPRMKLLLPIIQSDIEMARILAIKISGKLAMLSLPQKEYVEEFRLLLKSLPVGAWSASTTDALFHLSLGWMLPPKDNVQLTIQLGVLVPVVVQSLKECPPQKKAPYLTKLVHLFSHRPEDIDAVIQAIPSNSSSSEWCQLFSAILTLYVPSDPVKSKVVNEEIIKLIGVLVTHAITHEKNGVRSLEDLTSTCLLFLDKDESVKIIRGVLRNVNDHIMDQVNSNQGDILNERTSKFLSNFVNYIPFVEESIFSVLSLEEGKDEEEAFSIRKLTRKLSNATAMEPSQGLYKDGTGQWQDLALAIQTTRLIDLICNKASNSNVITSANQKEGGLSRTKSRLELTAVEQICSSRAKEESFTEEIATKLQQSLARDLPKNQMIDKSLPPKLAYLTCFILRILKTKHRSETVTTAFSSMLLSIIKTYRQVLILLAKTDEKLIAFITNLKTAEEVVSSFDTYDNRWDSIFTLFSQAAAWEGQELTTTYNTIRKRSKDLKGYTSNREKDGAQEAKAIAKLASEVEKIREISLAQEANRRAAVTLKLHDISLTRQNDWKDLVWSMKGVRGPWGDTKKQLYWKLDTTENFQRMRLKLKRNLKFNDHKDAALTEKHFQGIQEPKAEPIKLDVEKGALLLIDDKIDEDTLSDEEVKKEETKTPTGSPTQKETSYWCQLVTPSAVIDGQIKISPTGLSFVQERVYSADSDPAAEKLHTRVKDYNWYLDDIREVHCRYFMLRDSALEIFLVDHTNFFLNFQKKERNRVYYGIVAMNPPNLAYTESRTPEDSLKASNVTKRWRHREISNFDYLMQLNTIAGRTYNDLAQYPVFPWVLADYTSEKIDLSDSKYYRDLSKPLGALNPKRLQDFIERYNSFDDPIIPKFYYGSHYSSTATVLYYLLRMEPFTTLMIQFQGGHFDHADRMFHSMPVTWYNCLNAPADVQELIPEFYYLPDFLINSNNIDFGTKQDGEKLEDVVLPPWAKTPQDLIRIHREALESDYVSEHLHEWIDLIFGYKQRGKNAVEAYNVFYYLTYQRSVDIDAIQDENLKKALQAQINSFGQTPSQLLKKAHPKREQASPNDLTFSPKKLQAYALQISKVPIIFIGSVPMSSYGAKGRIATVDISLACGSHRWVSNAPNIVEKSPFTFEIDPLLPARQAFGLPFPRSPKCFALSNDTKVLFSGGHWDNCITTTLVETSKQSQRIVRHKDIVTCLALSADGRRLVTGSRDTTVMVWSVLKSRIEERVLHILYGHSHEVTCVCISDELDVVISGSKDGTINIHTLRQGKYTRTIRPEVKAEISMIVLSSLGHLAFVTQRKLYLYNINGLFYISMDLNEGINDMIITPDDKYLVLGGGKGSVIILNVHNLQLVHKFSVESAVCSVAMAPEGRHLMLGLRDGKLLICVNEEFSASSVESTARPTSPRETTPSSPPEEAAAWFKRQFWGAKSKADTATKNINAIFKGQQ